MKTLIAILIIASFIQSAILPIDLVLLILIARSYIKSDKNNLFLAFGFGMLVSHLNLTPLGLQSLIYLTLIVLSESLAKSRLAGNPFLIIPLSLVLVSINGAVMSLVIGQSIQIFPKNLLEATLSLPILYLLRLWEERFIVRGEIKLKI